MPYKDKNDEKKRSRQYYEKNKKWIHKRQKLYRKQNGKKINEYGKKYRFKNKDKCKEYEIKQYGLTIEDYNDLFNKQNGCCVICNKHQSQLKRKLFVDHDHKTGKIRGLLCYRCNSVLGFSQDNIYLLQKMINYLIKKDLGEENAERF